MIRREHISTMQLTVMHLLVDGICACCMMGLMVCADINTCCLLFLSYNLLAFATQPFTGCYIDRASSLRKPLRIATLLLLLGSILTVLSESLFPPIMFLIPTLFLGLGNSIFHVCGGKYVTLSSRNDIRSISIFVSSGAMGLAIGQAFCVPPMLYVLSAILLFLTFSLNIETVKKKESTEKAGEKKERIERDREKEERIKRDRKKEVECSHAGTYGRWTAIAILTAILLIVFGRSFIGKMIPTSEGTGLTLFFIFAATAMTGKAMGGFIAMKLGLRKTLVISLSFSVLFFILSPIGTGYALAATWLVNSSMPITLHYANRLFPRREGYAFGLLAAALIAGYLLATLYIYLDLPIVLIKALLGTIIIEGLVLIALGVRSVKVLTFSSLINICTNVPLNILALCLPLSTSHILILELLVVAVEALAYRLILRNTRKAFTYSLSCNIASYLAGLAAQYIFVLI
ncbi:MAG: MFS transporter [Bacteroidales bacterium]|nr:MFS transporter [Bacteroidales bacterium]